MFSKDIWGDVGWEDNLAVGEMTSMSELVDHTQIASGKVQRNPYSLLKKG